MNVCRDLNIELSVRRENVTSTNEVRIRFQKKGKLPVRAETWRDLWERPVVMIYRCFQHKIHSQPSSRQLNNRTVRFCESAVCAERREHGTSGHQVVLSRVSLPSGQLQCRTQCQSLAFRNPRRIQRGYTIQCVTMRWNVWYCLLQRHSKINSANSPASAASLGWYHKSREHAK